MQFLVGELRQRKEKLGEPLRKGLSLVFSPELGDGVKDALKVHLRAKKE